MNRRFVYPGAIPQDTDILGLEREQMIAHGYMAQSFLGPQTTSAVVGLPCNPTVPASMSVTVGQGAIAQMATIDATAFGSLAANANPLMKIGINAEGSQTITFAAPTTSGQSVNYLIEATMQENDTSSVVLPYYNTANPANPFSGPNNTGVAQPTTRAQIVDLQVKAGTPNTTGLQTTPAVDAGWIGLYVVTVAYGQTTITAANIQPYGTKPQVMPLGRTFQWTFPTNYPQTDVFLNVGDKAIINFVNANLSADTVLNYVQGGELSKGQGMPLNIATTQGVYKLTHVEYKSTTTNDDHYIFPNNSYSYGNVFIGTGIGPTQDILTQLGTSTGPEGFGLSFNPAAPGPAGWTTTTEFGIPAYSQRQQISSGFYSDTFIGAETGFTGAGCGRTHIMIISTYTQCKMIGWLSASRGGVKRQTTVWNDTTTAWTSLGTTFCGTIPNTDSSGVIVVERLV